jgi:hypothetical protein
LRAKHVPARGPGLRSPRERESPTVRIVGIVATAIGIVTGVGTIIGWIASQSREDTLAITLPAAGAMFLLSIPVIAIRLILGLPLFVGGPPPSRRDRMWASVWLVGFVVGPAFAVVLRTRPQLVAARLPCHHRRVRADMGTLDGSDDCLPGAQAAAQVRARRQDVPDCCETIKAGARVCRYCGFCFASRPTEADSP